MGFLARGTVPEDPVEELRVKRRAADFSLDLGGQLWVKGVAGAWVRVPPMKERA